MIKTTAQKRNTRYRNDAGGLLAYGESCMSKSTISPDIKELGSRFGRMTAEELQDEIDIYSHVCRRLGQFRVKHTDKTDALLDRLVELEAEQRRRMGK